MFNTNRKSTTRFPMLYSKFIRETIHKMLSYSPEFCRRLQKNMLVSFFRDTVYRQWQLPTCNRRLTEHRVRPT